jgi:hypothetical protein
MLTIAGGIILAIIIIFTIGIWLPLLIYAVLFVLGLALLLGAGLLIYNFPEGAAVFAVFIAVIFGFVYIGELWEERKSRLKERKIKKINKENRELWGKRKSGLKERKIKKINKENIPNRVNKLKADLGSPEVLIRNKSKAEMIEMAKDFEIEFSETGTKREIAEKIFQIGDDESHDLEGKLSVEEGIEEAKANEISRLNEQKKEASLLLEKIEEAKVNETSRRNEQKKKKEEEKKKKDELFIKKFSRIKSTLQELQDNYSNDENISIFVEDYTADLQLGEVELKIFTETDDSNDYRIWDDRDEKNYYFKDPGKVINYIIQAIGKFLAERESD